MSQVTISTFQIPDWRHSGPTAKLRLYANRNFTDSLGVPHLFGTVGSRTDFYQEIDLTISGTTITVPTFTTYSTTDARTGSNVRITGQLFDSKGIPREILFDRWRIPDTPSATSWATLETFNQDSRVINPPDTYLTASETSAIAQSIAGTINDASSVIKGRVYLDTDPAVAIQPIAVGVNSTLLGIKSSSYASLSAAVTAIGATPTILRVTNALPSGATTSVPSTLRLQFEAGGSIVLGSGHTVTILSDTSQYPRAQIFSGTGTATFAGNRGHIRFLPEWWGAVAGPSDGSGIDCAAAMNAAFQAARAAGGGTVSIGLGTYKMASALDCSSLQSVRFEGPGGRYEVPGTCGELLFTAGAGVDRHIDVGTTAAFTIYGVGFRYNNALFTGDMIGNDAAETTNGIHIDECGFNGMVGVAYGARAMICLPNADYWRIENSVFFYARFGIAYFDGIYSNVVRIEHNWFSGCTAYAIGNPYNDWNIEDNVFEPNSATASGTGVVNGIACAINSSGVLDGVGAPQAGDGVTIKNNWFGDDTVNGGIRINWSGTNLVVAENWAGSPTVHTFLKLRSPGPTGPYTVRDNFMSGSDTSKFIDNVAAKARQFTYEANKLVVIGSGTITEISNPGWLMPEPGTIFRLDSSNGIAGLASAYVGEEVDHQGVQAFNTTQDVMDLWDGVSFKHHITQFSPYAETLLASVSMNLNTTSWQDAYTNTTGKVLVVTRVVFRAATAVFNGGSTTTLRVRESVGSTAIGDGIAVTGANNLLSYLIAQAIGTSVPRTIANNGKVQVSADAAYGSAQTCSVDVFGFFVA